MQFSFYFRQRIGYIAQTDVKNTWYLTVTANNKCVKKYKMTNARDQRCALQATTYKRTVLYLLGGEKQVDWNVGDSRKQELKNPYLFVQHSGM